MNKSILFLKILARLFLVFLILSDALFWVGEALELEETAGLLRNKKKDAPNLLWVLGEREVLSGFWRWENLQRSQGGFRTKLHVYLSVDQHGCEWFWFLLGDWSLPPKRERHSAFSLSSLAHGSGSEILVS